MATKDDLQDCVLVAIGDLGGSAQIVPIARHIWQVYEPDLRRPGDLFFTWQYDMGWAATKLRQSERLRAASADPDGTWSLPCSTAMPRSG